MKPIDAHTVPMRWDDIDGLGHVGHTVVLTYLEEGRDAFLRSLDIGRFEYVVGRCSITYLKEIKLEWSEVAVRCRVRRLGRSSLDTFEQIHNRQGEVAVEAEFGLVTWDPERSASRPISDTERTSLGRELAIGA